MCGICGFTGPGDDQTLSRMMNAMSDRGPDDSGQWHDGKDLYLGHLRLSIVDLSDGQQPMTTVDQSLAVVFNGEIYNHRELRTELEACGHKFRSDHSDTEVLLHGYREWGCSMVQHLNGMWAFVVYDRTEGLLWLSRDRFGEKPLYYTQVGTSFVFSSELSSIALHPIVQSKTDELSLMKYFSHGYVPAPRSMLTGVYKLPAGHNLIFDLSRRSYKLRQYWRLEFEPDPSWVNRQQELGEALVDRLSRAVDVRLQADVPVGVFLSGGVDSSGIVALASNLSRTNELKTYSIGFEEGSFDESRFSNQVATMFGTDHTSQTVSADHCINLVDSIYGQLDEPMADVSLIPGFLMCKIARKVVKVALGGDGADELFAGYDPFRALKAAQLYSKWVPSSLHDFIVHMVGRIPVSHQNMSFDFKAKKFLSGIGCDPRIRNSVWLSPLPLHQLNQLFGSSINPEELFSEAISAWEAPAIGDEIERTLQFYTELYLQNDILCKMDRAGMLNSLEVRSPYLDIELVNLVRTIPSELKSNGSETKVILKKAFTSMLPGEICNRPKKGFGVPVGKWFKEKILDIDPAIVSPFVDTDCVKRLRSEHIDGKADWRNFLWAHFVLERWLKRPEFVS